MRYIACRRILLLLVLVYYIAVQYTQRKLSSRPEICCRRRGRGGEVVKNSVINLGKRA
jgi:hypothetical protein